MKVSYDPLADAMYIYLSDKKSTRTEEIRDDLLVDYAGGNLVGIEILEVSKKLPKEEMGAMTLTLLNKPSSLATKDIVFRA